MPEIKAALESAEGVGDPYGDAESIVNNAHIKGTTMPPQEGDTCFRYPHDRGHCSLDHWDQNSTLPTWRAADHSHISNEEVRPSIVWLYRVPLIGSLYRGVCILSVCLCPLCGVAWRGNVQFWYIVEGEGHVEHGGAPGVPGTPFPVGPGSLIGHPVGLHHTLVATDPVKPIKW